MVVHKYTCTGLQSRNQLLQNPDGELVRPVVKHLAQEINCGALHSLWFEEVGNQGRDDATQCFGNRSPRLLDHIRDILDDYTFQFRESFRERYCKAAVSTADIDDNGIRAQRSPVKHLESSRRLPTWHALHEAH